LEGRTAGGGPVKVDARVADWLAVQPGMTSVNGDIRQLGDVTGGGQGTEGGKAEGNSMSLRLGINFMVRQRQFRGAVEGRPRDHSWGASHNTSGAGQIIGKTTTYPFCA